MSTTRRLSLLLVALVVLAVPAIVLRAACVGRSCPRPAPTAEPPPFCDLPEATRAAIAAGSREGRSPDVLAFGRVATSLPTGDEVTWSMDREAMQVPLVLLGDGIRARDLPEGITLDAVAPTLAELAGLRRPHPEARTGTAIPGLARPGAERPLLVVIVWAGVGSETLERDPGAWPGLRRLLRGSASTMTASTGSVPVDPAAVLATIGSGALPSHHGVTGTWIRTDDGEVVPAWSPRAPVPVIAFLGDDLDEATDQRARIGVITTSATDRGLIGGNWYLRHDRDEVMVRGDPAAQVADLLRSGYGAPDRSVDLLGVVLRGRVPSMDRATATIVRLVHRRVPGAPIAITATGGPPDVDGLAPASGLLGDVERATGTSGLASAGAGGMFLDPDVAGRARISDPVAARALAQAASRSGIDLVAFPGFAVTLRRFC